MKIPFLTKKILAICFIVLAESLAVYSAFIGLNPQYSIRFKTALANNAVFSPEGKFIATSEWKKIQLWQAEDGREIATLGQFGGKAMQVEFSPNGNSLVAMGADDEKSSEYAVKIFDVKQRKLIREFRKFGYLSAVAVANDNTTIAVAGTLLSAPNDYVLSLYNLNDGKLIKTLAKSEIAQIVYSNLVFSSDDKFLIGAANNRLRGIDIFTLADGSLQRHKSNLDITHVALSNDQKTLAAGTLIEQTRTQSPGGTVRLFEFPSMKLKKEFSGHSGHITAVSFDPQDQFLAVSNYASSPSFWIYDVKKLAVHHRQTNIRRNTEKIQFSPDGKSLAVVNTTFGDVGNPPTLDVYDFGSKEYLMTTGALNDINTFKPNDKVKVFIDGKWYSGVVNKTGKGQYLIKMDNQKPEYWKWVMPGDLRKN